MLAAATPAAPVQQHRRVAVGAHRIVSRRWEAPAQPAGPPLVGVHGLVVSSRYLVPLAERLGRHRDVHAPDLPGFGRSSKPRGALDVRELARALAGWMDATGLVRADVLANSFGCQVAVEAALQRPDLVGRLVLLGPTIDPEARTIPQQLRRWQQESRTQSLALQGHLVVSYARAGIPRAVQTLRIALADRIEDKLPLVDVPALVVRGTRDPIVPEPWARRVADLLPQGRLVVLPGATHAINHEQPDQAARVIEHFLTDTAKE